MDNQVENTFHEQAQNVEHASQAFQAQAEKAGEHTLGVAKEFSANLRAATEKALHESRARYAKTKTALVEANAAMEASLGAARHGVTQMNAKALEALAADAQANFDMMTSAFSAKTFSELLTLNTEFVRKRFEDTTARAKTFSELARKVAEETASPIREQATKTFKFAS